MGSGSLAARLEEEQRDNMGAAEARAAARALASAAQRAERAAERIEALTGAESPEMIAGLQRLLAGLQLRVAQATAAAEEVYDRQMSVALIKEAGRAEGRTERRASRALRPVR